MTTKSIKNKQEQSTIQALADVNTFKPFQSALPTVLCRTGIFRPSANLIRNLEVCEQIPSDKGVTMHYKGYPLDELDADVMYELMRRANNPECISDTVEFTMYDFVKSLERTHSKGTYEAIRDSFARLFNAKFTIVTDKLKLSSKRVDMFGFVDHVTYDDTHCRIRLGYALVMMIKKHSHSLIHFDKRKKLRNAKAKWMQRALSTSTDKERFYSIEALQDQMRLENYDKSKFRADIKNAMSELQKHELIRDYSIKKSAAGSYCLTINR